ncbi:MAG: AsmA family protein [Rhodospirillaceae bacterium]
MTQRLVIAVKVVTFVMVAAFAVSIIFMWYFNSNDYRKEVAAALTQATGMAVAIDGTVSFELMPLPTFVVSGVRVASPPWSDRPEILRANRVEIGISPLDALVYKNRLLRLAVYDAELNLERNAGGLANWWQETETGAVAGAYPGEPLDIRSIEMSRLRIDYRDAGTGRTTSFSIDHASGGIPLDQPLTVAVVGDYYGTPFSVSFTGGSYTDLINDRPRWAASWRLEGAGTILEANGTLDRPLSEATPDLSFTLSGQLLSAMAPVLGGWLPEIGPYGGSGHLSGGWSHASLSDITGYIGTSDVTGRLTIGSSGPRPRLEGYLHAKVLRLSDLSDFKNDAWVRPDDGRILDPWPLPFAALLAVDAHVDLKIGRLVTWPLDLFDIETSVDLGNGLVSLQPLHFTVAGGRLELDIGVNASRQPPDIRVDGRGDGLISERLLPALGMALSPTGPLSFDLNLTGYGPSLRDFFSHAGGRARVVIGHGTLPMRHFDLIASDLLQAIMPWSVRHGDRTELNCVVAGATLQDGLATIQRLMIDTTRITVTGSGEINLATEQIDLRLDPRPKDPSLLSLATRVRVSGSLVEYGAAPDAVGLAKGAAAGLAMAIGELNPLALMLPFVSIGTGIANPCLNEKAGRIQTPDNPGPADSVRSLLDGFGRVIGNGVQ